MTDDFAPYGLDLWGNPLPPPSSTRNALADAFILPPFSVLHAGAGPWQDRKRGWKALGIRSEVGRDDGLCYNIADWIDKTDDVKDGGQSDTSIFDPVLCELAYRWFCPPRGNILDPFAGGSVRGIVAAVLGREYNGVDLRKAQVLANRAQATEILGVNAHRATWQAGDSRHVIPNGWPDVTGYDMVFTCPPYGDLERYSDDPLDLSTMDADAFREAYAEIIRAACTRLRADRFAAIVVGNFRDKRGTLRDFVGETIAAATSAPGVRYYNEIILQTATGTLAMRARKQFDVSRKIGRTHQTMLVFVKGDPKAAARAIGPVTDGDGV